MKLHEAMQRGAAKRPQIRGALFLAGGSCALGAEKQEDEEDD